MSSYTFGRGPSAGPVHLARDGPGGGLDGQVVDLAPLVSSRNLPLTTVTLPSCLIRTFHLVGLGMLPQPSQ